MARLVAIAAFALTLLGLIPNTPADRWSTMSCAFLPAVLAAHAHHLERNSPGKKPAS
jgi:hypothetical protein